MHHPVDTLLLIICANSSPDEGVHTIVPSKGTTLFFRYHGTADMESLPHFKALLFQTVAFGNVVSLFGFPASGDMYRVFNETHGCWIISNKLNLI